MLGFATLSRRARLPAKFAGVLNRHQSILIQPEQLPLGGGSAELRIIDCGSADAFQRAHVPGAVRLAVEGPLIKHPGNSTHVMPPEMFQQLCAHMGIDNNSKVVCYDNGQGWASAYIWWGFHYYGHRHVSMLDGGWPEYVAAGGRISARATEPIMPTSVFVPSANTEVLTTASQVMEIIDTKNADAQILDSRTPDEYVGHDRRGNARGGHVPGAINVPHGSLLTPEGRLKSKAELKQIFAKASIDLHKPVVTYCQMGMRGALAMLALKHAGAKEVSNYDGSMKEWLNDATFPVEV